MKPQSKQVEKKISEGKAFDIDLDRLEEEWTIQPKLVEHYGYQLADAKKEEALAEVQLDVAEAELSLEVRQDPAEFGLSDKPTVDAVKHTVACHKRYQKAKTKLIEATHLVETLKVAMSALEHKKKGLEKNVDLWSQGYFAAPRDNKNRGLDVGTRERRKQQRELESRRTQSGESDDS